MDARRRATRVIVVAVGGNALTAEQQAGAAGEIETNADRVAIGVAALSLRGWRVVVVHGNGPQVGNLAIQQVAGADLVPAQPLYSLSAMSQGQLGSALARAIDTHLGFGSAVALVSHVTVDPLDPAFGLPTKPIGPFYTQRESAALARVHGWAMVEDAGRGYRRVVPSPRPLGVVETDAVRALLGAGKVVLAGGGGGVAVSSLSLAGVDAVVDKDRTAARIAADLNATMLLLVTGTDSVMIDFGTPSAHPVREMTVQKARQHLANGQFPPGSMGPKVEAAAEFARSGAGVAVITSIEHLSGAVEPASTVGTRIVPTQQKALA